MVSWGFKSTAGKGGFLYSNKETFIIGWKKFLRRPAQVGKKFEFLLVSRLLSSFLLLSLINEEHNWFYVNLVVRATTTK